MQLRLKLFLVIFIATLAIGSLFLVFVYRDYQDRTQRNFINQYASVARILRNAVIAQEQNTEDISRNAAAFLRVTTKDKGLPSQRELRKLAADMHVNRMSIINRQGKFIRDTSAEPETINVSLFDFCAGYKDLITTSKDSETTPIIPESGAANGPIKYTMIADEKKQYIYEVGMPITFIDEIFRNAVAADNNISSIGLYSPTGFNFGKVDKNGIASKADTDSFVADAEFDYKLDQSTDQLIVMLKVSAPITDCCECLVKKVSLPDSSYYYKLFMKVSTTSISEQLASMEMNFQRYFLFLIFICFILAFSGGWFVYKRFKQLSHGVKSVMKTGNISQRIHLGGSDELADIANNFDQLLSTIEIAQKELVEHEKGRALVTVASQVAHDIRSPIAALENISRQMLRDADTSTVEIARGSIQRIKDIANDLSTRWRQAPSDSVSKDDEWTCIHDACMHLLSEKEMEFFNRKITFEYQTTTNTNAIHIRTKRADFLRALSNIINNAADAVEDGGEIKLRLYQEKSELFLAIQDDGCGMNEETLEKIFDKGYTKKNQRGQGLGLHFVSEYMARHDARLQVQSKPNHGTLVLLCFNICPTYNSETEIILFDDDPWIRECWINSLKSKGRRLKTFDHPEAILKALNTPLSPTVIFIDLYYGDKLVGFSLAEALSQVGYKDIYICTGLTHSEIEPLPAYVKGVISKEPPDWL